MRALLKSLPFILLVAFTAACAPPPPPSAEVVELVDSVWSRYPELRAQLLAQEHRLEDMAREGGSKLMINAGFVELDGTTRATVVWEQGLLALLRSGAVANRTMAESYVAKGGAAVLAGLKWNSTGTPPGWPATAPSAADCIAHHVMVDRPFLHANAIEFCDPALRDLAWAALTQ